MLTQDITFWQIRRRKGRGKPYEVRWRVGTESQSKSFLTRTLADHFRAELLRAARVGESFDTVTGLALSMLSQGERQRRSWFDFAQQYVTERWPESAPKSRDSMVDGLATATRALVDGEAAELDPHAIYAATRLSLIARDEDFEPPAELATTLRMIRKGTLPITDLAEPALTRRLLRAIETKVDGEAAASDTAARRRRVVNTALEYAVENGELAANPLKGIKRKRVAQANTVDRRVVVNPSQATELITAVSYVGSWKRARGRRQVAFFATLYYAGLRPAEAVGLRRLDCLLPPDGWGSVTVSETRPSSGRQFTNSREVHDRRGLKQRDARAVRVIPIPAELVAILRGHLEEFGAASDGRLFRNERGGVLGSTAYSRIWEEARRLALSPSQVDSPLAGRPYDLRHAALSTWLNAGVDPTDVAERAGNSVEVLLKRYAKCIDGRQERNNRLIERALHSMDGTENMIGSVRLAPDK